MQKPHVAVVGAGAFGGWTAYQLLREGARVTLVDAWGPGNSRASSGGESRVIRGLYGSDRIYTELVARSYVMWREAEERWRDRFLFETGGLWMFGDDDSYARESLPHLKELGLPIEQPSVGEARKGYPQIAFDGVKTIYFEERAGHLLARRACRSLLENLVAEGGRYLQAAVRPGDVEGGTMAGTSLSDGSTLTADAYLFACGPWLSKLFPDVIGDRVLPTRQEIYFFGPPASGSKDYEALPVWVDFGERVFYGVPGTEGQGFKVADDTRGEVFDPTTGNRTPTRSGVEAVRNFLARRFPGLRDAPLVEARVCQYENSPDGHYLFDRHPGAANAWILGGGSGHGFKLCPALGEHAAKRILGEAEIDPFFSLSRLKDGKERSTQFEKKKS